MIVCCCFGTTDREIRAAFRPGGSRKCPAGQGCGGCWPAIQEILAKTQQRGEAAQGESAQAASPERRSPD
jgi:bacterioferritin-associated ferredoxin